VIVAMCAPLGTVAQTGLAVALVLLGASVLGDVVHTLLHRWAHSRVRTLRALAALHEAHHAFFDADLRTHPDRFRRSALLHHLPETALRVALCGGVGVAIAADPSVFLVAVVVVLADLVFVLARRGRDLWHRGRPPLPAPRGSVVVDGAYHALHHAFPDHFLAAHVQLVDRVLGTLLPLRRRRVVITGATAFVAALQQALLQAGADVVRVDPDVLADADGGDVLADADLVVLGHGAAVRGAAAYEALSARAAAARAARPLPLDVWTIGDDAAWSARASLLSDERVILRRLVRAPTLGVGLTLALLRRGARVI
jgi:hypothetical protein